MEAGLALAVKLNLSQHSSVYKVSSNQVLH